VLFEHKVSARKFDKTEVDVFAESVEDGVMAGYRETLQREKRGGEEEGVDEKKVVGEVRYE
jgi:hypothetical protein